MFGLGEELALGSMPGVSINSLEDWDNFAKASQNSSYQTDHATLTGMAALRKESLEPTLRTVVAKMDSFKLWKSLTRQPVTSAVHEYMIQTSRGGQVDGMNIGEMGEVSFDVGDYQRKVERIKLFATGAQLSHFAEIQTLEGQTLKAIENENALVRIANAVERSLLVSRADVSPNKINGFYAQVDAFNGGQNVIDMKGSGGANDLTDIIYQAKADVRQEGVYGDITDIWLDAHVQNDLDRDLFPQYRVQLDNNPISLMVGAPVAGVKTSYGIVKVNETIWNNSASNTQPQIVKSKGRLPDVVPAQPTLVLTPIAPGAITSGALDGWTAGRAGTYFYAFASVDAEGREGIPSVIQSVTLAAGGAVRGVATAGIGSDRATGGRWYRSKQLDVNDVAPTLADLRLVTETPFALDGTSAYVDTNQSIPGASNVPMMNMVRESIQWLQLRPATQFPFAVTNTLAQRWAVLLYGTLMLGQPQHHYYVKNFLPTKASWKPFKA